MNVFDRLAPYIKDFIYRERWEELREVQVAACNVIFDSDNNLLLSTGTASGKTEAAFLPTLTKLFEHPSSSVGILYISPLKALINDQFFRLNYLLKEGNVPVCKWHGDASQSAKHQLIRNPKGVLQITPESLEALLLNKRNTCIDLFKDLRFVIIDEVHYFMNSPRGIQLLCELERLQKLVGIIPRRIGLSATLGDYAIAENWLNSGTNLECSTPIVSGGKRSLGIAMERFKRQFEESQEIIDPGDQEHFEYLYKNTLNKKTIIFANTRSDVEYSIANIKKIAEDNHTKDVYRVHHGNISAVLREDTEKEMKSSEEPIVTGATVTLELGVDIGSLDRIVQIGAPFTVSSFTQRLGRCGRRGQRAEMIFTFIENKKNSTDAMSEMDWEFLRTIAIIQLYLEEKWVEPITPSSMPFALLYHQTMSHLASRGETSAAVLAQDILTLSAFKKISQSDYRTLLQHLIAIEHLQKTERGGLIIGRKGEMVINNFEFYAVFESPVEYFVKNENQAIGTLQQIPAIGEHFALSGRAWECIDVDKKSKTIFVKFIKGVSRVDWRSTVEHEFHTRVLKKMKEILSSDVNYAYLSERCIEKLTSMRNFTKQSGFTSKLITELSDSQFAIFPWIGSKQLCALSFALESKGFSVVSKDGIYLVIKSKKEKDELQQAIINIMKNDIDKFSFLYQDDVQIPFKYNDFVPAELLRKQFIEDYVDLYGMKKDIRSEL